MIKSTMIKTTLLHGEREGRSRIEERSPGRSLNELGGLFWIKCVSRKNSKDCSDSSFSSQPYFISAALHVFEYGVYGCNL